MAERKPPRNRANPLRSRAEILIRETARNISDLPVADARTLVHELHVHQLELEMQNERHPRHATTWELRSVAGPFRRAL